MKVKAYNFDCLYGEMPFHAAGVVLDILDARLQRLLKPSLGAKLSFGAVPTVFRKRSLSLMWETHPITGVFSQLPTGL